MDYKKICFEVVEISRRVGEFVLERRKTLTSGDVAIKGKNDFVTVVDKLCEEKLVAALSELLPESGFIAEEGTSSKKGDTYNWIIDPIDGTTNFMHGAPPFCISIALQENDEIVIGVVLEMFSKECFYSWKGGSVFVNDQKVTSSECKSVDSALIATGFPYTAFERIDNFMDSLVYFMEKSQGFRRLGSAAMDLAYVAAGRYDAFYEYNLNPWDVAAGAFLVQQSGGKVSDFTGGDNFLYGKEIVASAPFVYADFYSAVNKIMTK
jgi:myo-inositol-1(or 4)-monophosphatase